MKEGIGGCGGTYPTVRKCVDQNSGIPKTLPRAIKAHEDSSVITARGLVKGTLKGSHSQMKGGLVKTWVFCQCKACREEAERRQRG